MQMRFIYRHELIHILLYARFSYFSCFFFRRGHRKKSKEIKKTKTNPILLKEKNIKWELMI